MSWLEPEIDDLGASFDAVVDRVQSRVASLAEDATNACEADLNAALDGPLGRAQAEIDALKATIADCDQLSSRVVQLEGLYQITQAMRQAVVALESKLR